jgi:Smr domain
MQRKPRLTALWHALDEAAFGAERILNLRESLPSASEARARTEAWLRGRQVTKPEEVLIITGRGNQSVGGVGIIRQEILGMLPSLRRRGVVESWREHSPGSVIVKLAPMSALFSAPRRRRDNPARKTLGANGALTGLEPQTLSLLRELSLHNLDALGVEDSEPFVLAEMTKIFSTLTSALPDGPGREEMLRDSIIRALDEPSQGHGKKT